MMNTYLAATRHSQSQRSGCEQETHVPSVYRGKATHPRPMATFLNHEFLNDDLYVDHDLTCVYHIVKKEFNL